MEKVEQEGVFELDPGTEMPPGYQPLPRKVTRLLKSLARKGGKREVCGLILDVTGDEGRDYLVMPITNTAVKDSEFAMDEIELLRAYQHHYDQIIGVYHSHPGGTEYPSDRDIENVQRQWRYFIIANDLVFEWNIDEDAECTMLDVQ